jgi:phage gp36-like protein
MEYTEKIINLETNEVTIRNFTEAEIKEIEEQTAKQNADRALADKIIMDKMAERDAALSKLGLTADEIRAIFG